MKTLNILLSGALVFTLTSCGEQTKNDSPEESVAQMEIVDQSTPVLTRTLAYADFTDDLVTDGSVTARLKADLRFLSSDVIAAVYVKNGDRVSRGQKIAELDPFRLQSALDQSEDNFERAKLDLQDVLIGQGYTLRDSANIPTEVLKIAKVRSNYDQRRINLDLARKDMEQSVIHAPFNGVVANLFAQTYNYSAAGNTFCTILDDTQPGVVFNILESEMSTVSVSDEVSVRPYALNEKSITGRITEINPVSDEKTGLIRVKATIPAISKLFDGMKVQVIIHRKVDKQLIIPKSAVVLRTGKEVVFTLVEGKAYWNYVTTTLENASGYVVIDDGRLKAGDVVIYDGNINLAHETPVTVLKQ